jgi:hypothetical protein
MFFACGVTVGMGCGMSVQGKEGRCVCGTGWDWAVDQKPCVAVPLSDDGSHPAELTLDFVPISTPYPDTPARPPLTLPRASPHRVRFLWP